MRLVIQGILFKSLNINNRGFVAKYKQAMNQFSLLFGIWRRSEFILQVESTNISQAKSNV
jgi:hypothetical protein